MTRAIANRSGIGQLRATPPVLRTQQSLLFPTLLSRIEPRRRLSVFEIGAALPETVEYFSQFKCRLHFASMFTDSLLNMNYAEISEKQLSTLFIQAMGIDRRTRFDICLFWDFFNYLDDKVLRAFNAAIRPHIHKTTRAHAFTLRTLDTALLNQQYGIEQPHMFRVRPRYSAQKRRYPKTQATLVNLLPCFDIDQGMLLPDGRLEVLMSVSQDGIQPG